MCDGLGIVIWFANWKRSGGVDVEVEMILTESVFCGVVNSGGLVWNDESEAVGNVVHESVDWR